MRLGYLRFSYNPAGNYMLKASNKNTRTIALEFVLYWKIEREVFAIKIKIIHSAEYDSFIKGTLGQPKHWDIYDPSTYQHPMAPYDVLVDPVSIPDHPLLDTKSESEDRGEHIDKDPSFKSVRAFCSFVYCFLLGRVTTDKEIRELEELDILW